MPTLSDIAVVLRQWDFSETSQTVRVLTRDHGAIRGLAKGARRERGMFSGGFEVCTRGQLVAIVKPGRDLATLTEWRLLEVFPSVRGRLVANRAALLAADLVAHLLTDGDPHPEVFDELIRLLRALAQPGGEAAALLRFQWRLLESTGFSPRLETDVVTGRPLDPDAPILAFRPDVGGFTEADPAAEAPAGWRLRRSTLDALRAVVAESDRGSDSDAAVAPDEPSGSEGSNAPPHSLGAAASPVADPPIPPIPASGLHKPPAPGTPHEPHPPREPHIPHDSTPVPAHRSPTDRANRLLATYVRHVVGRELPTIEWAFGQS